MSGFEHKPGSFALFKNDRKERPNQPDYTGNGKDLEGHDIRVAAWLKEGRNGKFMSCSFSYPQAQREQTNRSEPADQFEPDSDIPF